MPEQAIDRPEMFSKGAYIYVVYRSPRSDRDQHISGKITHHFDHSLALDECDRMERPHNDHRDIIIDTETMDVYSKTDARTQRLGQVIRLTLSIPPWESFDGNPGWTFRANWENRMVREGVYEFPDPDWMDQPDDWEPEPASYRVTIEGPDETPD